MDMRKLLILLMKIGFISAAADWDKLVFTRPDNFPCNSEGKTYDDCANWIFDPNSNLKTVFIKFDEEQEDPITIAYVHCIDCIDDEGADKMKIGGFLEGSRSLLGPELRRDDKEEGKYWLIVQNKLDYEIEEQREFKFALVLGDRDEYRVKINVFDIDDNPPRVIVHQTPCVIPENYDGETNCTYSIYDPDTVNKIDKVTFVIPDNVNRYFTMKLKPINNTDADSVLLVNGGDGNQLDFETMPVYYFQIIAKDGGGNEGKAEIMIKVEDVNDQPPVWIDIFAMQTFEENIEQIFTVYAKDGDLEVNDKIDYKIDCDVLGDHIKIEAHEDGVRANIFVSAIDREAPDVENNNNRIKCSLTASDPIFDEKAEISFIIQDVNDNAPEITFKKNIDFPIILREEEFVTLEELFSVDDKDEGINAQFDVKLENEARVIINYTKPFQVIPNNGYRNWKFSVSVIDPELLDYDRTDHWREFSLKIHSEDKGETPQHDEKSITIKLQNLNDEIPEFDKETIYELKIREDVNASTYILNVLATDKDVGDKVRYNLLSEEKDYVLEDQKNGSVTIYTTRDGVFDYEKIRVVYIQVLATDTLIVEGEPNNFHTVTQQIQVTVQDVNDEKPRLTLPYKTPQIEEHSDVGQIVTSEISAVDVDTTAKLEFFIIWEECRASKLGIPVDTSKFKDVFSIEPKYIDNKTGQALGILKVNDHFTLDYEIFDTILLYIQVKDQMQEMGEGTDEGIMTVLLIDINDNAPEFDKGTINSNKSVAEHSKSDLKIGTIIATDIDGVGNNNITYFLEPVENTKPGLMKILPTSGELVVDQNEAIDADFPDYIQFLYYKVIASDIVHNTTAQIKIFVEDINDMKPFLKDKLENDLSVKERESTDEEECIQNIRGDDHDRDDPHNLVSYYLNNELSQLSQKYKVDETTGQVCAFGKIEWKIGQDTDKIYVILEDNKGGRSPNAEKYNFTIKIEDIDNHDPVLPEEINIKNPPIREDIDPGTVVAEIIATDEDKPCTDNTKIDYSIEGDKKLEQLFDIEKEEGPSPKCEQIGVLKTKKSLQEHYGKISIRIRAKNPKKTKYDEKSYEIDVKAYNFKPPRIIYPSDKDSTIILQEDQTIGEQLIGIDERPLRDFEASDDQNGKFKMQFAMTDSWDPTFKLDQLEDDMARLVLVKKPTKKEYTLKFEAYHNGEGSASNKVEQTIIAKFLDKNQLPSFNNVAQQVAFEEETMEPRCQPFEKAEDPKCFNEENCNFVTYYHIMNNEEKINFEIDISDKNEPKLCLLQVLDREELAYHYLTIVATNYIEQPTKIPNGYNPLNLTVRVIDINDNDPVFDTKSFKGGLADSDPIDTVIVTLKATDPDEVDEGKLWYHINDDSITVSDPSLEDRKNKAFTLQVDEIKNLFQPSQQMQGYFVFKVQVFDTLNHTDTAEVKIHIVSNANRITFRFEEDIDNVKSKTDTIEEIFTKEFEYSCTVDKIEKKANDTSRSTKTDGFITEVKTHFVDSKDDPVEKDKITVKLDDIATIGRLKIRLEVAGLTLLYVDGTNDATDEAQDMNYLLKILLIVVSVVLGTLCAILIVAFILRTRSLQKRLEAMTTNVFGSTKSDLNRIGTSAPGTNRHAIEANPVWNEDLNQVNQFDTISQGSGGSDLIGVEDKPEFEYDIRRASVNPVLMHQGISEQTENINGQKLSRYDDDDDDINSLPGFDHKNSTMF